MQEATAKISRFSRQLYNRDLTEQIREYNNLLYQLAKPNGKRKCQLDSGHILAASLGGPPILINTFPMSRSANRGGEWKEVESSLAKQQKKKTKEIRWAFKYINDGTVPDEIHYDVKGEDPRVLKNPFVAVKHNIEVGKMNPLIVIEDDRSSKLDLALQALIKHEEYEDSEKTMTRSKVLKRKGEHSSSTSKSLELPNKKTKRNQVTSKLQKDESQMEVEPDEFKKQSDPKSNKKKVTLVLPKKKYRIRSKNK